MPETRHHIAIHVIFTTKKRRPLITSDLRSPLYRRITAIITREGCRLLAIGGMPDHVHLLILLAPRTALATLVKNIKGASARWINQHHDSAYFRWQQGYGAFSVGHKDVPTVRRYIQDQEQHHARDRDSRPRDRPVGRPVNRR